MLKPICVQCGMFYRVKKSGYYFIEGAPRENGARPGKANNKHWTDYKLWCGDLWECRGCDTQIIVGTGHQPVAEKHHPDFHEQIQRHNGKQFRVNDC